MSRHTKTPDLFSIQIRRHRIDKVCLWPPCSNDQQNLHSSAIAVFLCDFISFFVAASLFDIDIQVLFCVCLCLVSRHFSPTKTIKSVHMSR